MRFLTLLSLAAAAVAATIDQSTPTGTVPTPHSLTEGCEAAEIPCEVLVAAEHAHEVPAPAVVPRYLTNAQRLARRLPLKAPHRRSAHRRHEDTPAPAGPSTLPPTPPTTVTRRGVIQAINADTNVAVGYISLSSFSQAQLRYQPSISTALIVSFKTLNGMTSGSRVEVTMENSDITMFEFLSLVQGRDNTNADLGAGSFHYAYLSASISTPPGSPGLPGNNAYSYATGSSRLAQSAVWFYDEPTGDFAPQWINSDGSVEPTAVFSQSTALYFGGDPAAFLGRYPSPVTNIALKFVPI